MNRWHTGSRTTPVAAALIVSFGALAVLAAYAWRPAWGDSGPDFTLTQFLLRSCFAVLIPIVILIMSVIRSGGFWDLTTQRWMSIGTGVLCLTATALVSFAVLAKERRETQQAATAVAAFVAGEIQSSINSDVLAITRMARRLDSASELRQSEWEADAENYMRDIPGMQAIARLDNDRIVRWSWPRNTARLSEKTLSQDPGRRVLQATRDANDTRVSPVLELFMGGSGILIATALHRADDSAGFLIAALQMEDLWKSLLASTTAKGYRIEVLEDQRRVYQSIAPPIDNGATGQSIARLPGIVWTIRATAPPGNWLAGGSSVVLIILVGGTIVSLLVTLSIAVAQAASSRARESELVKGQLETEIRDRQKFEEVISENEERFRLAFGGAPIGMALVTRSGKWLRVNDSVCRMLGYTAAELLATDFQALTHPDDLGADLERLAQVLAGEIESYSMDKRYFHKSGRIVHTSLHVSFVKDRPGRQGYFVSQIMDISQRVEMDRVKREFISTVSHELRTPLTSIAGSLELVAGGVAGELPTGAAQLVEIAERNSRRLVRLIDDILYINKAVAGKLQFELQPQPLAPIVRQSIEANQEYAASFGVQLLLLDTDTDGIVRVDRDRLIQVLTNLISNAAKFSPPGSQVVVAIEQQAAAQLRVSVRDQGPGIAESFRARIFQQFAQADSPDVRSKGGTGLGLSIAKAFMERLGGSIDYDSTEGAGSTFRIYLPTESLTSR